MHTHTHTYMTPPPTHTLQDRFRTFAQQLPDHAPWERRDTFSHPQHCTEALLRIHRCALSLHPLPFLCHTLASDAPKRCAVTCWHLLTPSTLMTRDLRVEAVMFATLLSMLWNDEKFVQGGVWRGCPLPPGSNQHQKTCTALECLQHRSQGWERLQHKRQTWECLLQTCQTWEGFLQRCQTWEDLSQKCPSQGLLHKFATKCLLHKHQTWEFWLHECPTWKCSQHKIMSNMWIKSTV